MSGWLSDYLYSFSYRFFAAQSLTILLFFFIGLLFVFLLKGSIREPIELLLAYPVGLSLYILAGFLLLVTDTGFKLPYIFLVILLLYGFTLWAAVIARKRKRKEGTYSFFSLVRETYRLPSGKMLLLTGLAVLAAALFSCSGLFSVSLSNDSYYYFSLYPRALVHFSRLMHSYNVFLTDVGLGAALIGTLPYFFGFQETFGIQTAFFINFLLIFGCASAELFRSGAREGRPAQGGKKLLPPDRKMTGTILCLLLLLTAMPFVIISKWAMANGYFTGFMFTAVFTAIHFTTAVNREAYPAENVRLADTVLLSLLLIALSSLRMEGVVILLFLLLSFSTLPFNGKRLALFTLLPCIVLYSLYYLQIFVWLQVEAPYTFLTRRKAVLQILAMAAVFIFLNYQEKLFKKWGRGYVKGALLLLFSGGNVFLFISDRSLYLTNLKSFYRNLTGQSGWGVFPVFAVSAFLILVICHLKDKTKPRFTFMDFIVCGYLLLTLTVCFARGDPLQDNVGDSGNRVLLQSVPLIVYALAEHFRDMI
ncbi:MAG: hypothetical protein K6G83_11935 [Lachnospiraceae bacterium]|nr:hypothetical protein [Lachnospiraceae bacterium]